MKLMIIESPGKIPKLKAILGDGWQIAASVGHVRDLPKKAMGVEPPDFKPQYELIERGVAVIAKLKALAKQADAVYLATDPDREGESISWHLQQCLRLDNPLPQPTSRKLLPDRFSGPTKFRNDLLASAMRASST